MSMHAVKDGAVQMSDHENRVARELSKAQRKIFALNSILVFYLGFLVYYLDLYLNDTKTPTAWILWTMAGASLVAGFIFTFYEGSIGQLIIYRVNRFLKQNVRINEKTRAAKFSKILGGVLIFLTFWLGWLMTGVDIPSLVSADGLQGAQRIFMALLQPNLEIVGVVCSEMIETIFIGFMATALSIPIAFVASFFCAKNLVAGSPLGESFYVVLRFIFNFTRSVEPLIWAIVFSVWVGIGPFAGMLALMLHSIASLVKLYSEQIESIERGPIEAIEATGAGRIQTVWYAVVPQIVLPYLAFTIFRWDINIRMATIIGLVGGGGVGTLLMQYQGLARWSEVGTIVIIIAIVVWAMDWISAKLREAIY